MAEYTDIDKLRELEAAATPAPWHARVSVAGRILDVIEDHLGAALGVDPQKDTGALPPELLTPDPALMGDLHGLRPDPDVLPDGTYKR